VSPLLAGLVAAGMGLPHVLRLERAAPGVAATIWFGALALRALTAILCALFVILYVPATALFGLISHWCWHAVVPFLTTHLHFDGHALGDATLTVPTFVLAASLLSVVVGLYRAARQVQILLRRTVGEGPDESVLLADGEMLVAAAGIRHPRVLVSAGALLAFDDEELAASLEHERGHIARRHRYLLVLAELFRALARFLPGTRAAMRELVFHLERDADRYAIARDHDPSVLASAICKAAVASRPSVPTMGLGGGVVTRRIGLLLEQEPGASRSSHRALKLVAAAMLTLALLGAGTVPSAAHAGYHGAAGSGPERPCQV